ncbi:hypothetical protein [Bradyrhizobium oligotrophicum]|uniref:hypothetical protein n=1 Tax=Bradyrhizobium oligotrophicum TaxID=44255 RepID=UPI003EBB3E97
MPAVYPDLESAIAETLEAARDQNAEFKRRLRRLIENATIGNLADDDVAEVIELASVSDDEDE